MPSSRWFRRSFISPSVLFTLASCSLAQLSSSATLARSFSSCTRLLWRGRRRAHILLSLGSLHQGPNRAAESFSFLKGIHSAALINAEALRKLVKKFDKMHYRLDRRSRLLSAELLPLVYASNFTGSLASLEAGLALLRVLLGIEEEEEDNPDVGMAVGERGDTEESKRLQKLATFDDEMRHLAVLKGGYFGKNKQDIDTKLQERRKEELQWLKGMVQGMDGAYIPMLVGHRGFHSIHDRSDVRPLENSLMAYEAAWTNGVHLCECDIALTKDERIILAHDENFARLGMDPASPLCNRTVRDLTFKELMNCPLKSGARPPLLFDVLRSAAAIGGDAKMIVEIKPGNAEAGLTRDRRSDRSCDRWAATDGRRRS